MLLSRQTDEMMNEETENNLEVRLKRSAGAMRLAARLEREHDPRVFDKWLEDYHEWTTRRLQEIRRFEDESRKNARNIRVKHSWERNSGEETCQWQPPII